LEDIPVAHREYQSTDFPLLLARMPDLAAGESFHNSFEDCRERSHPRSRSAASPGITALRPVFLPAAHGFGRALRRSFDAVCAAAGLAVLVPVFALIALAIKLDDGGPIFYSHVRIGKGFRNFRLFKFRSMISISANESTVTAPQDARITRVGQFLRRFKLDELPQLVNVLKGEMQLVGARPQMERFVEIFHDEYEELLQSAPGITDVASLIFRDEARFFYEGSIEEQYIKRIMPIKLEFSLKYSRTRTFFSDIAILFRTVLGLPAPSSVWKNTRFDRAAQSLTEFNSRRSL
jgi:lipopolysaccharide/colanic/teichoic acid biosynthesis glycosyltransferase